MANRIFQAPQINLSRQGQQPLFVDREAFFEFSFWMSAQLNELVEKHHSQNRIKKLHRAIDQLPKPNPK